VDEPPEPTGMAAEAAAAETQRTANGGKTVGTEVGGYALEPRPEAFDRVEFGGVGREAMHREPRVLSLDMLPGHHAAVGVQAVPEQDDGSADVTSQVLQEVDDLGERIAPGWVIRKTRACRGARAR